MNWQGDSTFNTNIIEFRAKIGVWSEQVVDTFTYSAGRGLGKEEEEGEELFGEERVDDFEIQALFDAIQTL